MNHLTVLVSSVFTTPAVVRLLITNEVAFTIEAVGAESPEASVPAGVS